MVQNVPITERGVLAMHHLWPLGDGELGRWMYWLLTAHVRSISAIIGPPGTCGRVVSRPSRSKRTSICGSCCATSSETRYGLDWCRAPSSGRGPAWLPSLLGRPNRCSIPARPRADLTGSRPSMPRCLRPTCRLFVNASSATRRSAPSRGFCRLHPLWDFSPPSDNAATYT